MAATTTAGEVQAGTGNGGAAFSVPVNLYTKLVNAGKNADFRITWEMPHSGDYDLEELFARIDRIGRPPGLAVLAEASNNLFIEEGEEC